MKRPETEKTDACCRKNGVVYCCNHPDADLGCLRADGANTNTPRLCSMAAAGEYAQDTAAWD